jgi:crotonobetaine/carnitine-CoA ligase
MTAGPASVGADLPLGELLERRAAIDGAKVFMRFTDSAWTYAETLDETATVAHGLGALGVAKGSSVCVLLPNCPELVLSMLSIAWLGAVEVPINTAYKGEMLRHQIDDSEAAAVIVHADLLPRLLDVLPTLSRVRDVVVVGSTVPTGEQPNFLPWEQLRSRGQRAPREPMAPSDTSAIMYTSGTTGRSKGVVVTHRHASSFALDWADSVGFGREDVLYTPLPLFHSIARTLGVLPTLLTGAEICIVERFSASRFWDDVRAFDATVVHGIFGMIPILLNQPPGDRDRDHRVRSWYIGSSAMAAPFRERFGVDVIEVYGATETGIVTRHPAGADVVPGSCGRPNDATYDVDIFDDEDDPVGVGEIGEIVVRPIRSFTMLTEYFRNPEATAEAFRNLWFHTGDYGRRDDQGYIYFVDRKKDAIRRRGENISSAEVEAAVNTHPAVLESAAVAVPADIGEDEVKICVVLRPGAELDEAQFIGFLNDALPYFMVPRFVEIFDELPKTPNGKVQKMILRSAGDSGITDATWDREEHGIKVTR